MEAKFLREVGGSKKDPLFSNIGKDEVGVAIEFTTNPRFKFSAYLIDALELTLVPPSQRDINFLIFNGEGCVYMAFWKYIPDIGQEEVPTRSSLITSVNKSLKGNNKPEVEAVMSMLGVPNQEGTSKEPKYHLLEAEVIENPFTNFETAALVLRVVNPNNNNNEESNTSY